MKWFRTKDLDAVDASSGSSDSSADDIPPSYCNTTTSNWLFLIGSVFYLWLAVLDLQWEKETQDIPDFVLNANDDAVWALYPEVGDDIVFQARYWPVSKYQIIYFFAALSFVIEGFVDFFGTPGFRGFCFILAGAFGLVSCFLQERDVWMSTIFNAISAHLFVLEALGLLFNRDSNFGVKHIVRASDAFFVIATSIDLALSYCTIFDVYNLSLAKLDVSSSTLWLACACIYVGVTIWAKRQGFFDKGATGKEDPYFSNEVDDEAVTNAKNESERSSGRDSAANEHDDIAPKYVESPEPMNKSEMENEQGESIEITHGS